MEGNYVGGYGPTPAPWALVGEAPGKAENALRRGFVGPAGMELNSYLRQAGVRRAEGYITNLVKRQPPGNRDPTPKEIEKYATILEAELEAVEPSVVGAVGRFAARYLLGQDDVDMDTHHGLVFAPSHRPFRVVVCYHPAAGLHQPELAARSAEDFKVFGAALRGQASIWEPNNRRRSRELISGSGPQSCHRLRMLLHASLRKREGVWLRPPRVYIDTEGTPQHPFCLSLSILPNEAYVILATDTDLLAELNLWLLEVGAVVVLHNSLWDLEVLAALGIQVSRFEDTMVKAAQLTLEPLGLKPLAYRHLGVQMQNYDDLTRPYHQRLARRYLTKALLSPVVQDLPKPDPVLEWKKGVAHIRQPQHVSRRITSAIGSMTKEPWEAWFDIEDEIRAPVEALLGPMPPFTLDQVPIEEVVAYAGEDADMTGQMDPVLDRKLAAIAPHTYEVDRDAIPMFAHMQRVGMKLDIPHLKALKKKVSTRMAEIEHEISHEYYRDQPFNPRSTANVVDLLFDKLRLHTRIKTKVKGEDSTGDKALKPIQHEHRAVALIIEHRMNATIDSRFTHKLWEEADEEERVHPHWRITKGRAEGQESEGGTVTGRPSCTKPNLLAIPIRTERGREVRAGFVAEAGKVLGGADENQVEMRYMAHESNDELLLKWYAEGIDVHTKNASEMFGIPVDQVDKFKHRDPAKRTGFGIITGITGVGLFDQFELNGLKGWSQDSCQELIDDYMRLHPGVRSYMDSCYAEAEALGYVKTRLGRIRYLPGIYSRQPRVRADAQRASHSHKIQGGAAEILKEAMKVLWAQVLKWRAAGIKVDPLLQIYDELVLEIEEGYEEMVMGVVKKILEAPSKWMRVPLLADVHTGHSWRDLK